MNAVDLIESFSEFKEMKNIDRGTMMRIVEDVFRSTLKRKYGTDENVDVIVNPDKGDLEMWLNREIVPDKEVEDEATQISLTEALKIEPEVGMLMPCNIIFWENKDKSVTISGIDAEKQLRNTNHEDLIKIGQDVNKLLKEAIDAIN